MNNYICENAIFVKQGLYQAIRCKKTNDICPCARYCPTKGSIEHSQTAQICIHNPNKQI